MKPWILLVAVFAMTNAAQAQINKCTNAAGKTVYSQDPCPKGAKASTVATAQPSAASAGPAAKSGDAAKAGETAKSGGPQSAADQEREFRKRQQEQGEALKKEEERLAKAGEDRNNCETARRQLAGLDLGGRQTRTNEKGEREFMDDAQVEQAKQRARQAVASSCK